MGLPSEANVLENLPKQSWPSSEMICWTVSQPHSPEIHHVKFLSKTFSFFFQFFMSCTHLISRLPQCICDSLCHFTQYIQHMQIYHHAYIYIIYNYTTCNSTISTITQISSLELNTISSPMAHTHNYIPYN